MSDFPATITPGDTGHDSHHELLASLFREDVTQGLLSARPAAGVKRRTYFATDVGRWYRDDGVTWHPVLMADKAQVEDPAAWIDVRSQGATGLGVVDDAPAVQSTIDLAAATPGTATYLAGGTYLLNSTISVDVTYARVIGSALATLQVASDADGIAVTNTGSTSTLGYCELRGFAVQAKGLGSSTHAAVHLAGADGSHTVGRFLVSNVRVLAPSSGVGFKTGFRVGTFALEGLVENCAVRSASVTSYGYYIESTSNAVTFVNSMVFEGPVAGIYVKSSSGIHFVGGIIEGSTIPIALCFDTCVGCTASLWTEVSNALYTNVLITGGSQCVLETVNVDVLVHVASGSNHEIRNHYTGAAITIDAPAIGIKVVGGNVVPATFTDAGTQTVLRDVNLSGTGKVSQYRNAGVVLWQTNIDGSQTFTNAGNSLSVGGNILAFNRTTGSSFIDQTGGMPLELRSKVGGVMTTAVKVDANGAANDMGCYLFDVSAGTVKRVSRGAADSAGVGFRQLRVAN